MKKLINSPDSVVTDALAGVAAAHPSLAVDIENKVITRATSPQGKSTSDICSQAMRFSFIHK